MLRILYLFAKQQRTLVNTITQEYKIQLLVHKLRIQNPNKNENSKNNANKKILERNLKVQME